MSKQHDYTFFNSVYTYIFSIHFQSLKIKNLFSLKLKFYKFEKMGLARTSSTSSVNLNQEK